MVHFLQPYDFNLNIGRAYNQAVEACPAETWICITDQDTLKFDRFAQRVLEITRKAGPTQVITCMTNRLRKDNKNLVPGLYQEPDIDIHYQKYNELWQQYGPELERTKEVIAGAFMLFHRSVWERVKFREQEPTFDGVFTTEVRRAGFTTHVAKGLYIFHLYRWGRDPGDTSHLYPGRY